jgi:hypothetical protein
MLYLPQDESQDTTERALSLAGVALVVLGMLMFLGS